MKQTISQRRKLLKITQQHLADAVKVSRQRISDIETLKFHPHEHEKVAIADKLQCSPDDLVFRAAPPHKPEPDEALALVVRFRHKASYRAPRDRSGETRVYTAMKHYPSAMRRLKPLLARPDVSQFVADAPFQSLLEFIKWLERIGRERAYATEAAPLFVGFDQHPVVCPETKRCVGHCPVPAVVNERWLAILQVSVHTPRLYTMDALICTFHEGTRYHFALEVDGPKKPPPDPARDAALGLPILRFTQEDILNGVGIGDKLDEYFHSHAAVRSEPKPE